MRRIKGEVRRCELCVITLLMPLQVIFGVRLPMHLRVLGSRMPLYVKTFCLAKTSTKTGQVLSLANFIRLASFRSIET